MLENCLHDQEQSFTKPKTMDSDIQLISDHVVESEKRGFTYHLAEGTKNAMIDTSLEYPTYNLFQPPISQSMTHIENQQEIEINGWDDAAAALIIKHSTPGDYLDCLFCCRRSLKLQVPPSAHMIAENVENGFPLPRGIVWFVRDFAGVFCIIATWLLIGYAEFVVIFVALPRHTPALAWLLGIVYHIFAVLAVASHAKSMCTDPGSIRIGNATKDSVMRIRLADGNQANTIVRCPNCLCIKPERTHHCSCCRRCIRKMDHHCPWVNNCIGQGNQKYFVLFNLYIFCLCICAGCIVSGFVFTCFADNWSSCYKVNTSSSGSPGQINTQLLTVIFLISLGIESLLFGLFTLAIGLSQICAICKDETAIESLKRSREMREKISYRQGLSNVFGSPLSWRWLSPFTSPPPLPPVIPHISLGKSDTSQMDQEFVRLDLNGISTVNSHRLNHISKNDYRYNLTDHTMDGDSAYMM